MGLLRDYNEGDLGEIPWVVRGKAVSKASITLSWTASWTASSFEPLTPSITLLKSLTSLTFCPVDSRIAFARSEARANISEVRTRCRAFARTAAANASFLDVATASRSAARALACVA